jgi:hypothetical protein
MVHAVDVSKNIVGPMSTATTLLRVTVGVTLKRKVLKIMGACGKHALKI